MAAEVDIHAPLNRWVRFRFYAELNDFLPPVFRQTAFEHAFIGTPSVKDLIEAIGVPHSEIDLILVDDVSVGFEHRLRGGERVAVYPVFEALDISPVLHLRPAPLRETRFIVDVNLGKLAQKLRLLGFDTCYRNDLEDDEIVHRALAEGRIILTRDMGILRQRAVTHGLWVRSDRPAVQLREVVRRLQLEQQMRPFTRCSRCNGLIEDIDKRLVQGRVAEATFRLFDHFWQCVACGKLYWKGSHHERICRLIDSLNARSE